MCEEISIRAQKTNKTLRGFEKYLLARRAACAAQLPHEGRSRQVFALARSRLVGLMVVRAVRIRLTRTVPEPIAHAGEVAPYGWGTRIRVFASQIRTPPSQARSGETLKTCHWHVFLTRFHLIGSNPCDSTDEAYRPCWRGCSIWLGYQDSNLDSWHQKPESCRWTIPQRRAAYLAKRFARERAGLSWWAVRESNPRPWD